MEDWKESLAVISTYGRTEDFPKFCVALAEKLNGAGKADAAVLCHICAGNVEAASLYWSHQNMGNGTQGLQALIEKVCAM